MNFENMITEQENALHGSVNDKGLTSDTQNAAAENREEIIEFYNNQILSAEHSDNEVTNNDGSVKETLDTAFHDEPGYISDHSLSGSNRADYYEKRSQGVSDAEEEQEYIKNHQQE
jgi:hypothetical protein